MSQHADRDVEAARGSSQQGPPDRTVDDPNDVSQENIFEDIEEIAEKGMKFVLMPVWARMKPEDMPTYPTWEESLHDMFVKCWYNIPFVVVPLALAWASHFDSEKWGNNTTFVLCFIAMIPLQKIFDWGGDEIGLFLGNEPRDLLVITLSNAIEAALAIILLFRCQLRLLQSTVIGVVLLHLLLIPGVAFFIQGAQIYEQRLHQFSNLNHSLLMIGVLGILVPTVFFAALDRGSVAAGSGDQSGLPAPFVPLVSDAVRRDIVQMSRGIAVMLLLIYITGCLYRHNVLPLPGHPEPVPPPARANTLNNALQTGINDGHHQSMPSTGIVNSISSPPRTVRSISSGTLSHLRTPTNSSFPPAQLNNCGKAPPPKSEVNPWVCVVLVIVAVAFMGVTAEFLVSSIETLLETSDIQTEWFGLVLLPIVSFSADGAVVVWNFSIALCRYAVRRIRSRRARKASSAETSTDTQAPREQKTVPTQRVLQDAPHIDYVDEPAEIESHHEPPTYGPRPSQSTSTLRTAKSREVASSDPNPNPSAAKANPRVRRRPTTGSNRQAGGNAGNEPKEQVEQDSSEDVLELPWVSEFAHGRPIDLSIQFTLWWTPFLVLLGWWTGRPMHLLFDYFEVGMLLGACFLVNYVTVDEKTNMSEGLTMISFYAMIATAAWFYPGQPQVAFMLNCPGTVAEAVAQGAEGTGQNLVKILI
ncbi:hypothetical protein BD309DRAFT_872771 [Dichomitus squalens]|uniref:Sodium/calcium exchanger membrane region domain-containing protein n=1 Tax=Dichomitus squalens TaxID=114155 RepID=A0A4Q9NDW7_9APHY|nr:hypothetical protein BD309DRAFT_872771 [Dichomitus squalens]TBU52208.1 hypothetical protein BD310DRAFT_940738 [Dichomitus squalens]